MTKAEKFLIQTLWDIWRTRKRGWGGDGPYDGYVYKTGARKGLVACEQTIMTKAEYAPIEARNAAREVREAEMRAQSKINNRIGRLLKHASKRPLTESEQKELNGLLQTRTGR